MGPTLFPPLYRLAATPDLRTAQTSVGVTQKTGATGNQIFDGLGNPAYEPPPITAEAYRARSRPRGSKRKVFSTSRGRPARRRDKIHRESREKSPHGRAASGAKRPEARYVF